MAIQHKVEAGQTLSGIAHEYGVTVNDITGFRSNDPNTIFPGEILNITQPLEPATNPTVTPAPAPTAPGAPVPNQSTPTGPRVAPAPVLPGSSPIQTLPDVRQKGAPVGNAVQTLPDVQKIGAPQGNAVVNLQAPAIVPGTQSTPQKPAPI